MTAAHPSTLMRLLLGSCLALLGCAAAQADCLKWDINGRWHFVQSNDTIARFDLQRDGSRVTGSAYFEDEQNGLTLGTAGSIDGTVEGDRLDLVVYWEGGSIGVYQARITSSGALEGSTYDRSAPATTATWRSDRNARCISEPQPLPPSKPAMALGRVRAPSPGCALWKLQGEWNFYQNNESWVTFDFRQDGNVLEGTGSHLLHQGMERPDTSHGVVNGRVAGNRIDFTARWDVGSVGVYSGVVSELGRVSGETYDQDHPEKRASWTSDGRASCLMANPAPPVAPPLSLCDAARSARARNSPAAPSLEAQCRQLTEGGSHDMPVTPPAAPPAPARAPVTQAELDRLAAIGRSIAGLDVAVGSLRRSNADAAYRFGFDVATAIFGDPALGAQGNTAIGPGSLNIRAGLDASGQQGFDEARDFHFSRNYAH